MLPPWASLEWWRLGREGVPQVVPIAHLSEAVSHLLWRSLKRRAVANSAGCCVICKPWLLLQDIGEVLRVSLTAIWIGPMRTQASGMVEEVGGLLVLLILVNFNLECVGIRRG